MSRIGETLEQTKWRKIREELGRCVVCIVFGLGVGYSADKALPQYHAPERSDKTVSDTNIQATHNLIDK